MLSEGKNLSIKLKSNMIQYLFEFFEGDKSLILSQINKKFKRSFLDFLLSSPEYEISYTIKKDTPLNDLFLRVHLTELIFKDYEFSFEKIAELKKRIRVNEIKKIRLDGCSFAQNNNELKKRIRVNEINTIRLDSNSFDKNNNDLYSSLVLMSYISSEFTNLSSLIVSGIGLDTFRLDFEVFQRMGNLKHLSITNLQLIQNSQNAFKDILNLKNLESLDLSGTNIDLDFINSFCKHINCFPKLKILNFSNNDINIFYVGIFINFLGKSGKKLYVDLSKNYINTKKFKNEYPNLTLNLSEQKKEVKDFGNMIMRMLFSRSGEVNGTLRNSTKQVDKRMGKKNNGAILPLYVYSNPSQFTFDKEELRRILRVENTIRLSRESQLLYDQHKYSTLEDHLLLDKDIIIQALNISGYNPKNDDSLKAYHMATAKYVNDEEVRNEVVWMKYDKCKVGNFQPGDKAVIHDINVLNLLGEKKHFGEILSSIKPNVIVCGSLS